MCGAQTPGSMLDHAIIPIALSISPEDRRSGPQGLTDPASPRGPTSRNPNDPKRTVCMGRIRRAETTGPALPFWAGYALDGDHFRHAKATQGSCKWR
jgi:hypothetical protein